MERDEDKTRDQLVSELSELRRRNAELEWTEGERALAAELSERLNHLRAEILGSGGLDEKLKIITDGVVEILGADFARIWIIKEGDLCDKGCSHANVTEGPHVCRYREWCLHLVTSSGRYTHLDGPHRRVPFGAYKIGRFAAGDDPKFLTNDAANDSRIHDREWAKRLGLISFAGYRLLSPMKKPIGVMALFSKRAISQHEDALLEGLAFSAAHVIQAGMMEAALWESEGRLKTVVDSMQTGMMIIEADTRKIVDANPAAIHMIGAPKETVVGSVCHGYVCPAEEGRCPILDSRERVDRSDQVLLKAGGGEIPIMKTAGRILLKGREHVLESFIDVGDKKALEAQLQRAQRMEAIGTLAGGVAHDLNNILSGLVTYPELLLLDLPKDSRLRKSVLGMQQSGKKAAAIVQDLLTLARRGVEVREIMSVNAIVSDFLETPECAKIREFHPNVEFVLDLDPDLLNVVGSPVHVSKTIMNLVSNAAEAMPRGGKIHISTSNDYVDRPIRGYDNVHEGEYVVLSVSDSGVGMSPSDMARIFEPFFTKKVMGRSGTGLGMAVVWGTVKDHRGYIDVRSSPGEGTRFDLYFPATRRELAEKRPAASIDRYKGNERILVIDDVKVQRELAEEIFNRLEYSVTSVPSGEEAIEYLKEHSVDLLVLDMIMEPGIDGLETYKKILALHPRQKAIIVSGFSETDRVREAQRLGAGAYIKKPYILDKIGMAARTELDKQPPARL